jgi:hypothetical protein
VYPALGIHVMYVGFCRRGIREVTTRKNRYGMSILKFIVGRWDGVMSVALMSLRIGTNARLLRTRLHKIISNYLSSCATSGLLRWS